MPYSMRPVEKMSLLMADITADITTRFSTEAAESSPKRLNICTKGLLSPVMPGHGKMAISTVRVNT
ncbi:hypothetical protein D3C71_1611080 [compost metagenome]